MKRRWLALIVLAPAVFGAYAYYYSDTLTSIDLTKWWQNGSLTPTASGLMATDANGGSLISKVAVPDGTNQYEVKMTLKLTASGGTYVSYLRASSDARSGPAASGTYYAIEIQNPVFSGGACSAVLAVYKRVSGVVTLLGSTGVACRDGMTVRSVAQSSSAFQVWIDDVWWWFGDSSITSGQPGIGAYGVTPSGNSVSRVDLGPLDRVARSPVNPQTVGTSVFPTQVEIQWQGVVDDANGIGMGFYSIVRNGVWVAATRSAEFTDATLSAATTYTYQIYAADSHQNHASPASITVTTPPAGAIDARSVGVRSTGTYWGATTTRRTGGRILGVPGSWAAMWATDLAGNCWPGP